MIKHETDFPKNSKQRCKDFEVSDHLDLWTAKIKKTMVTLSDVFNIHVNSKDRPGILSLRGIDISCYAKGHAN